ncbi:MAG: glycosyltransferase family 1 protein [Pseudomonadota bacterium]
MHIGIDVSCWANRRGFGRFTRELVGHLLAYQPDHRYSLFTDQSLQTTFTADVSEINVAPAHTVNEKAVAHDRRRISDMLAFSRSVARVKPDVMYFPAVYSWFPLFPGTRSIVTFHDAIAERFPELIFPTRASRWAWRAKVNLAKWQADEYITVSHAAQAEMTEHLNIDPQRITVITEGFNTTFKPLDGMKIPGDLIHRYPFLNRPYLIYVGGIAPHKNLLGLLNGFLIAKDRGAVSDLKLVFVGDWGRDGFHENRSELDTLIAANPMLKSDVHFAGGIDDEGLRVLYGQALAGVMPAFSEGFGLPAVEAMACRTPVLASRAGSLPEVVGPGGLFFDPYDPADIATQIEVIHSDQKLREHLAQAALKHVTQFSWRRGVELLWPRLEALGES